MFQKIQLLPQNPAAARFPPVGLQTARKDSRFFTSPYGAILKAANGYVIRKINAGWVLNLKSLWPLSESLLSECFETMGSKTETKEPRSGKLSRQ
ncbi:hypothetical protein KWG64_25220 [Rahnella sp. PD12R]|nr:hypothetical protein [Rahnella sp. PD12R]